MDISSHDLPQVYYVTVTDEGIAYLDQHIRSDVRIDAFLSIHQKAYPVQVSYRGAHTRELAKKSYTLYFPDDNRFHGQREIHLNAEMLDPSLMRNALSFAFFELLDVLVPTTSYVVLCRNGVCEGLYLQLESVDDLFLQKRQLPLGPIYYAVSGNANFSLLSPKTEEVKPRLDAGYRCKYGQEEDMKLLRELIYIINTTPRADFEEIIGRYLNVNQYLSWLVGVVCTQNFDAFIHNYALYRNTKTGLFEIIPWDYDATWGRDCNGKEMAYDFVDIDGYNTLSARLLDTSTYKRLYKDRMAETLNSWFTPDYMSPRIDYLHRLLRPYLQIDPYKKEKLNVFDAEPDYICRFIKDRNHFLKGQLDTF
ncbi:MULTISPECIES: CotH kinase family protein [Brevibacillus]|uniref:CotH kinase family protein n=1 Tax=Brevibacillus TaxID=55080 RepID=UPI000E2EA7D3|nr:MULTISPECIES: CotH kinase family protein [Brevibacillus]MED1789425.1 CotH kinase family protein [Brevibacillus laterosporus]RFB34663.1 spore coat protein [Brevibacillus sp. VP]